MKTTWHNAVGHAPMCLIRIFVLVGFVIIGVPPTQATGDTEFSQLYDYYFPKKGEYVNSVIYRPIFDRILFGPPLAAEYRSSMRQFYYALRGDISALHRFLHAPDRGGKGQFSEGEFSEAWDNECVLLLLRLGDARFSALLGREDKETRNRVGHALEPQIRWNKHSFPKTRALYSYRYQPDALKR